MARKGMIFAAAAGLLLAAAPGISVAADPALVEAEGAAATPLGMTASELDGATLYGENGDALGEVEKVLATREGLVSGIVVETGGAMFGLLEREVLLRFDQVHRAGDRVATRLSRDQLRAQPEWDD